MDNIYVIVDGELYHHGIKGMKWGRRRFQNKDGSLTPAGVKRYGDGESSFDRWKAKREAKRAAKAQAKTESEAQKKAAEEAKAYEQGRVKGMTDDGINKAIARSQLEERYNQQVRNKDANEGSYRNKSVKDMNDAELARAIERSRMEQTYRQLNPEKVSTGKVIATKFLNEAIVPAAVNAGKNFLEKTLNKFVDKAIGVEVDELAKLKREFDIEDYKKKIRDLKNPKEEVDETISRLKKQRELDDLTDDEYYQLKKDVQKSKWRKELGDDTDLDDNSNGNTNDGDSGSTSAKKSKNKPKNDVDDGVDDDFDDDDTSSGKKSWFDRLAENKQAREEARAEKRAAMEEEWEEEDAREAEINATKENIRQLKERDAERKAQAKRDKMEAEIEEIEERLSEYDDADVGSTRYTTSGKIGQDFVSSLLSRQKASEERRRQRTDDDTDDGDSPSESSTKPSDSYVGTPSYRKAQDLGKSIISKLFNKPDGPSPGQQINDILSEAGPSPSVVSKVKAMTAQGMTAQEIADKYGISKDIVLQIRNPNVRR